MSYETFLDMRPTGGIPVSSDPDWLAYLDNLNGTGEAFATGWADHYPSSSGGVPVLSTKALTAYTTTASLTITKPASLASGDLIVIFVVTYSTQTPTSISGFTKRGTTVTTTSGADTLTVTLFDKIATGSEPASYTATMSASTACQAVAMRVTGASATPYVTQAGYESDAYLLQRRLPTVTTTTANNLLIGLHQAWYGANSNAPSGWTAEYTDQNDLYLYRKTAAGAGATGNTDFDDSTEYNLTASIVVAYAPTASTSGMSVLDSSVPNASDNNNPYSLKVVCGTDAAFYGGGKTVNLDLTSSTFGMWIWSDNWANVTEAHIRLCNDTTPTNYYTLSLEPLLTSPANSTWYYVRWSLADMTAVGTPDIGAITYLICGAKSTAATTPTVRFGRFILYPFANESLYFSAEVLLAQPNAMIWGESNWGGSVTSSSGSAFSDDFTTEPTTDTYIKWGSVTQSGSNVIIGPYSYLKTVQKFDLRESQVVLKTNTFPSGSLNLSFIGWFSGGLLQIYRTSGALGVAHQTPDTGYVINNYAVSTDAYWRIKHSGNTVTFSRSADGSSWTDLESFTTDDLPSMQMYMTYEDSASAWIIDSLNVGTTTTTSYGSGSVWTGDAGWTNITSDILGLEFQCGGSPDGRPETGTGTVTIKNDDRSYSIWSDTPGAEFFTPGTIVRWGVYGTSHWFPMFTGLVRTWKELTTGLEQLNTISVDLYQPSGLLAGVEQNALGAAVGDSENLPTRMQRLLTASGWQYGYSDVTSSLNHSTYTLQATNQSMNRQGECYLTADSANAVFRSSRRGKAFTYSLDTPWLTYDASTDPDVVGSTMFGKTAVYLASAYEVPAANEPDSIYVPYEADSVSLVFDTANIINEATGKPVGGTAKVVTDAESIAKHGTRSYKREDLISKTTVDLTALVTAWLRTQSYTPDGCKVNAYNHPNCLAFLLMLDVDRLVFVKSQDSVVFRTLISEYAMSIQPRNTEIEITAELTFKPYSDSTWWRI